MARCRSARSVLAKIGEHRRPSAGSLFSHSHLLGRPVLAWARGAAVQQRKVAALYRAGKERKVSPGIGGGNFD